ncbi:hypothetical protein B0T10DRAFT_559603 [Thelonectria olida]|uniref:Altered inheritance of mitochondria protein 6 n=1 Tax=Thelonectria olida TaxID=1576542 RepID=A0A9P8W6P3_9HYPO|nr:hypothetical protein B0T10DRAFT_559603 [Thelonectria olida]
MASLSTKPITRYHLFALGLVGGVIATSGLIFALTLQLSPFLWNHRLGYPPTSSNLGLRDGDTIPVPCSSHNDYWRERPLHSALLEGCIGVEADVWPLRGQLYVSHSRDRLDTGRTLSALYIDPLVKVLQDKAPQREHGKAGGGVYDADPNQTLVLLVDIKASPTVAWPLLLEQLEPLRTRGWLSHNSNGTLVSGPITVVASGMTRLQDVEENPSRDVFLDAPLAKLDDSSYNASNSYYASVSFRRSIGWIWLGDLRQSQLLKIRDHIKKAHSRGLKVRYWSLPIWPLSVRKRLWGLLVDEGLDVLHVDDLFGAREVFAQR